MNVTALRTHNDRIEFCDAYFSAVGATCIRQTPEYREYELPREVDKELTDRPYYWMWVEQTDQEVPPTVLRLAFTDAALQRENHRLREEALAKHSHHELSELDQMFLHPPVAELVTLGSFRLDRILSSVEARGRFGCAAVKSRLGQAVPWLMVNALISYRCDSVEQTWHSLGVCLENGQVVPDFFTSIRRLPLESVDAAPLLAVARVDVETALDHAKAQLHRLVDKRPESWAQMAWTRLGQEQQQLKTYYTSLLPDLPVDEQVAIETEMETKIRQLQKRMAPRIEIDIRQLALVGLLAR